MNEIIFLLAIGLLVFAFIHRPGYKSNKDTPDIKVTNGTLNSTDWCEQKVSNFLYNNLDKNSYRIINNVLIPSSSNTKYTQIDHIIVSRYGIFCIETKSHTGWIFGDSNEKYWKQSFYERRKKCKYQYPIYSPSWQNRLHINSLKSILEQNLKSPIIPIIAFPEAGKILVRGIKNIGDLEKVLEIIISKRTPIYNPDEQSIIINQILNANSTSLSAKHEHAMKVHEIVRSNPIENERVVIHNKDAEKYFEPKEESYKSIFDNSVYEKDDDSDDDDEDDEPKHKRKFRDYDEDDSDYDEDDGEDDDDDDDD